MSVVIILNFSDQLLFLYYYLVSKDISAKVYPCFYQESISVSYWYCYHAVGAAKDFVAVVVVVDPEKLNGHFH